MPQNSSVSENIVAARAKRMNSVPPASRWLIAACWTKKAPPRQVIKAFCQECVGYDRAAVAECNCYACPLWMYRPYVKKEESNDC